MGLRILGTGVALPAQRRSTAAIETELGLPPGQLEAATGVASRHVLSGDEDQISLGVAAATAALREAGLGAVDIDLFVSASAVPYQTIPSTAPLYLRRLGVRDGTAATFDINSTCLGFLNALEAVDALLANGRYRRAMVISSEVASCALPWGDAPDIAALFGDGAAAALFDAGGKGGVRAAHFRAYPSAYDACRIGAGGTRYDFFRQPDAFAANVLFEMDGKTLFRIATRHFGRFVDDLLAASGWSTADVDCVVPHQASPASLDHMVRQCGFAPDRVVRTAHEVGNQIAASIPFALHTARHDGRIRDGSNVLMLGTSAGVSFGGVALEA